MSVEPWYNLRIQPYIGERLAVISWEAPTPYNDAQYFIARSASGTPDSWVNLNPDTPITNGLDWFADDTLPFPAPGSTFYYKIRCHYRGRKFNSPAIELFASIPRHEYGQVAQMLQDEWVAMRIGGGIPAWHCIPLSSGEPAANRDPQTGLQTGAPCGDSYGLPFAGGYGPPLETRVRILSSGPISETDREEGMGTDKKYPVKLRLMAFPRPRRGHMLVCPGDQRFVLGEKMEPFFLKGLVPVAWEAEAELLDATDDRYRFPVNPYTDEGIDFRI